MQDMLAMLKLIRSRTPWALARFGDADAVALEQLGPLPKVNVHDPEDVDKPLQEALTKALSHTQENYWVGTCCPKCRPRQSRQLRKLARTKNLTTSNITQSLTRLDFIKAFKESYPCVWWVAGDNHDAAGVPIPATHIMVPATCAWSFYEGVRTFETRLEPGDVVFLSAGRLANVLVAEWFAKHPDCTFINIGTMFDNTTRNYVLPNHLNPRDKKCAICNPDLRGKR